MDAVDLGHLRPGGEGRVEAGHRLLENHERGSAHGARAAGREAKRVLAIERDFTGNGAGGRVGNEPQHRQRGDRFAGARFADDADGLVRPHAQAGAVHRPHHLAFVPEFDRQVDDRQAGICFRVVSSAHLGGLTAPKMTRACGRSKRLVSSVCSFGFAQTFSKPQRFTAAAAESAIEGCNSRSGNYSPVKSNSQLIFKVDDRFIYPLGGVFAALLALITGYPPRRRRKAHTRSTDATTQPSTSG